METTVVTGAAGFIGSHLVDTLLERGYEVRGIDDLSTGQLENLDEAREHEAFSFVEGSVRDRDTLARALDGANCVFHQAAVSSVARSFDDPATVADVNCGGTSMLFEVAADAGVETFVVASSAAVYGSGGELPKREAMPVDPESPYALSKYYTEQAALQLGDQYGIDAVALRYFNVYGPRQDPDSEYAAVVPKFLELMSDGERPVIYGDGEQSRDFVFVGDVVDANVRAVESNCRDEVLNVAGGRRITINDLVSRINDVLGTELEPIYDDPRPGDIRHSGADVSKANRAIEYEPTVDLETGLRRTADLTER
ncbi:NAD-dependent epimerase/dehydratase family protein [Halopiger xanaduensis]|uniref:UDP-glucose 4-epimerase n=1 Tax=Halopiger xanaduensis (strain DSM 18323 / JCM 14033 / SH-6) TaxID=797210 RepID=F8DA53_HALXS|nr:NAD-dependent epimerase/dehydratase family protein [Halopiger xanaduensis]AEH36979.1 UDP-glucose 4-epimerase [Halopiger xanaduensis SH-6]